MGRLINTVDLYNRLQAYDGFGAVRGKMLGIIWNIVMECPTATDNMEVKKAIDHVLEVIVKELNEFADSVCKDLPHKEEEYIRIITAMYTTRCKDAVKALKGGENDKNRGNR